MNTVDINDLEIPDPNVAAGRRSRRDCPNCGEAKITFNVFRAFDRDHNLHHVRVCAGCCYRVFAAPTSAERRLAAYLKSTGA